MPATLNIHRQSRIAEIDDPFYRYKMPKMVVVKQRTKVIIDNFDKVSKSLHRDPEFAKNYFKKKLCSAVQHRDGVVSTTAPVGYDELFKILTDFIEDWVLCGNCDLPETEMVFSKSGKKAKLVCKCCSHTVVLST